jgi:hypothetical protein
MDLVLEMIRDEPGAVAGAIGAALAAAAVLLWDLWVDEARIARARRAREMRPPA